jgi:hypothetical protein
MNEEQRRLLKMGKYTALFTLAGLKSFFFAVTQVAFGIASMFFLNLMLAYFLKEGIPTEVSYTFLKIEMFIIQNVMNFVWTLFVLNYFFEIKEILKK